MIADAQENRKIAEVSDLVPDEVVPGGLFVINNVERRAKVLQLVLHVFVEFVNRPEIAEMPVEACS